MRHLSTLLLLFALAATSLAAETTATAPVWKYGGDLRVRYYDMQNIWDWNYYDDADHWAALRLRTRVWASVDLERGVKGLIRLANQNWGEGVTDQRDALNDRWEQDGKSSKVFVDAAYIEVDHLFDLPANLRLGRQSLSYGTGFVVFDGQSHVGSTATYFDGARLRLTPGANLTADLIYLIDQENRRDESLPDDIVLMGLYLTQSQCGGELYALRRVDDLLGKDIWLTGARFARTLADRLDLSLEVGLQHGNAAPGVDQKAWGTKLEAGYAVSGWRPFVSYVGMSGDDPATLGVRERWDVFYGGWPQFGEHLAWTYINLGPGNGITRYDPTYAQGSSVPGEAVYSNLLMPSVGLEVKPHPRFTAKASWSWLRADRTAPGIDDEIGTYAQLNARYTYSKNLAFSVYGGYLDPGKALGDGADPQHLVSCDAELTF
jgi:hypothetical protein